MLEVFFAASLWGKKQISCYSRVVAKFETKGGKLQLL